MICVCCLHDLYTVEELTFYGGQIVIFGVRGGCGVREWSIGVGVVSVCWSIGGAALSVYCQYLG